MPVLDLFEHALEQVFRPNFLLCDGIGSLHTIQTYCLSPFLLASPKHFGLQYALPLFDLVNWDGRQ